MKSLLSAWVAVVLLGAATRAGEGEVPVTFTYLGPNAKAVGVAGEFSNWKVIPLTNSGEGVWSKTLPLKPGRYGYKLVVDDEWILDPKNPERKLVNGIENSAIAAGDVPVDTVPVLFRHVEAAATTVHLAGDFNNWLDNEEGKVTGHAGWQLKNDGAGTWTLTRQLKPGRYLFKYVIDGERWVNDAAAPKAEDGNSVLVAGAAAPATTEVVFELDAPAAQTVVLAGEFNQWSTTAHPLTRDDAGKWRVTLPLKSGKHAYKFVVDGQWQTDPANPETVPDGLGGQNSVKIVP